MADTVDPLEVTSAEDDNSVSTSLPPNAEGLLCRPDEAKVSNEPNTVSNLTTPSVGQSGEDAKEPAAGEIPDMNTANLIPNDSENDKKPIKGWPSRSPFFKHTGTSESAKMWLAKHIFWSELTWKQKMMWRKAFLQKYLTETKRCIPYVRKLFSMIFYISPWRAIVVFAMNIVSGLLPALTLQTRGNFIWIVFNSM